MQLEKKKAFFVFKNNPNWINILLFWALMFLIKDISLYLIFKQPIQNSPLHLVNFAVSLLFAGYINLATHREINNYENLLPDIEWAKMALTSISSFAIAIVTGLPTIILIVIDIFMFKGNGVNLSSVTILILTIIFMLANSVFTNFSQAAYLKSLNIADGFNFERNWQLTVLGWKDLINAIAWSILLAIVISIAASIICLPIAIPLGLFFVANGFKHSKFLSNIAGFAGGLLSANLIGQVYKETERKLEII